MRNQKVLYAIANVIIDESCFETPMRIAESICKKLELMGVIIDDKKEEEEVCQQTSQH